LATPMALYASLKFCYQNFK